MNQTENCPLCGSSRIVSGRITSGDWPRASFELEEGKWFPSGFPFPGTPSGVSLDRASACLECGHLWATISPDDLRAVIGKWGTDQLKARIFGWEEQS